MELSAQDKKLVVRLEQLRVQLQLAGRSKQFPTAVELVLGADCYAEALRIIDDVIRGPKS